jgi:hypothetical protein
MSGDDEMLAAERPHATRKGERDDVCELFHRLNNQLGIVLANAELLEARVADEMMKARATQIIDSALQAMATVRELRSRGGHGDGSDQEQAGA